MYKIIWSETSKSAYQQIQSFVLQNWSIEIVLRLDKDVEEILQNLAKHKHLCPRLNEFEGLRKCLINKQTSLIYSIDELNKNINLVTIVDNRMDHPFYN